MRKVLVYSAYVGFLLLVESIIASAIITLFYYGQTGCNREISRGQLHLVIVLYFSIRMFSGFIPYVIYYSSTYPCFCLKTKTSKKLVAVHVRVFLIWQTIVSLFLPGALWLGLPNCIHLGIGYLIVTGAVALSAFISKRTGITDWLFKHLDTEE